MNKILFRLVISQFKLFFREPGVVFWSFGFPVLMAWILGIAFANKGEIERNIAVVAENTEEVYWVAEGVFVPPEKCSLGVVRVAARGRVFRWIRRPQKSWWQELYGMAEGVCVPPEFRWIRPPQKS